MITIILFIGIVWYVVLLKNRIENLEKKVNGITKDFLAREEGFATVVPAITPSPLAASQDVPSSRPEMATGNSSLRETAEFSEPEPSTAGSLGNWIKEDWLLKLGAFIVLLGLAWFVSYAFAHNWIGEIGRVTLGMVLGVGILGLGSFRMARYPRQGSVFLGLGAMTIIISIFSAAHVYHLVSGQVALVVMLLSMAFTALMSVQYKVKSLAKTSIIIASLAPVTLLAGVQMTTIEELFAYLFVVLLGSLWVVVATGWRSLTVVSLVMFLLYSIPQFENETKGGAILLFAFAFAVLFFITSTVGILKNKDGDIRADILSAVGNSLLLLLWITLKAPSEWISLIIVGWMVLFLVAAYLINIYTNRKEPFFVYVGISVAMLAAATAVELEGAALTIAYIFESAILPILAYHILQNRIVAERLAWLMLGPAVLSLESMFEFSGEREIPMEHFFVLLIMSVMMLLLALFFRVLPDERKGLASPILFVVGSVYAYVLLWLTTHIIFADDTATMISLVSYTLIGLVAYVYGKLRENKSVHYYGGILLGFTIGHLLLVDVWDMEISGRIITFFVVGTLLMTTAFVGRNKKTEILQS